ncbi:MAG: hypothetical protein A2Z72_07540 [Omnitrophica bacterium RBG_13_46_9]|nr:MAG: hypothetical protein A2Z72_07540 [Omnitrophica bacterium RBG_13_46_9]
MNYTVKSIDSKLAFLSLTLLYSSSFKLKKALAQDQKVFLSCSSRISFTHEPESHACKGADEWLSVQGSAPPIERNPVKREATAVRRWSFTSFMSIAPFSRSMAPILLWTKPLDLASLCSIGACSSCYFDIRPFSRTGSPNFFFFVILYP